METQSDASPEEQARRRTRTRSPCMTRPSGEQEVDFILIQDDDADVESAQLRMTIQELNTEIQDLSLNVERAKWIIKYLEQRKKQLED